MKKLLLVFLLVFALCAMFSCGETDDGNNDGDEINGGETENGDTDGGDTDDGETDDGGEVVKYTVIWKDENGNEITRTEVENGAVPSYTYTKADTAEWNYTVEGWSATSGGDVLASLPAVSAETTYYAIVSQVKQQYTVTFDTQGGSEIAAVTIDYGTAVSAPKSTPKYSGHKFVGWSTSKTSLTAVDFDALIYENKTYYAIWNEVVDLTALLSDLLGGYKVAPTSYLPETMLPSYGPNIINKNDAISDYSSSVAVSDIPYAGFGQQWNMVIKNITESNIFFNTLATVETVMTSSLAIFNNYFDENPDNVAHHSIANGIYSITLDFNGSTIYYVLEYTTTLPVLGEQTVQVALSMDCDTKNKDVRVQLGEANALTYKITESSYEFAIKYLGVRTAYFSISEDKNGNISGSIYEFLSVSGIGVSSAAEFYTRDGYVYAIGNKADGIIGFTGYICETYDIKTGKLLGYEVRETLSAINFNTLWFNLADIEGINSIKYKEKTKLSDAAFYINGSISAFNTVKVGILEDPLRYSSRKFDIEFRTQYFYYYDATKESYEEVAVEVPMFFVQEEDLENIEAIVNNANSITIEILTKDKDIAAIMAAYDSLLPVFIENKELFTIDKIILFIGNKVLFD